ASVSQTDIQRLGLATIRNREQSHALVFELPGDDRACVILRTVVDHDDLVMRIIGRKQTANRVCDNGLFVVRRHENGNERTVGAARVKSFSAARSEPLLKRE